MSVGREKKERERERKKKKKARGGGELVLGRRGGKEERRGREESLPVEEREGRERWR